MSPDPRTGSEEIFIIFLFALGLVDKNGKDMTLSLKDSSHRSQVKDGILHIRKEKEEFVFTGIEVNPVLSVNRNFSAPVNVRME